MAPIPLPFLVALLLGFFHATLAQSPKVINLDLSWGNRAPDGVERRMILVNGEFPSPTIELDEGDDVVVEVFNGLDEESSIHFHGIIQAGTPWSDGTPGLSQRPIPPGGRFTYRWKAQQYGSYWYHSHTAEQVEDGLYGALTIHPRADTPRPFRLISQQDTAVEAMQRAEKAAHPVVMADHRHVTGKRAWELTQRARFDPACWDSILVNGKGRVRCMGTGLLDNLLSDDQREMLSELGVRMTDKGCFPPRLMATAFGTEGISSMMPSSLLSGCTATNAPIEVIEVSPDLNDPDGWVALHLVGAFHGISAVVSIDAHPMWVFAVDGHYVQPSRAEAVPITNGERFSVLIQAKEAGDFTIRVAATTDPQVIAGYATLRVNRPGDVKVDEDGCAAFIDDSGKTTASGVAVYDPNTSKPFPESPIPQVADETLLFHMGNAIPPYLWALNVTPLHSDSLTSKPPLLLDPRTDSTHIKPTRNGSWVDLVLITESSPNPPHPIHKHGNKMYLLGMGYGAWTWPSVEEAAAEQPELFNLVDPPLKDSFSSLKLGIGDAATTSWLAMRYYSDNPGPWLLHCHVLGHLVGGMQAVLMDGLGDAWPETPQEYRQLAEGGGGGGARRKRS